MSFSFAYLTNLHLCITLNDLDIPSHGLRACTSHHHSIGLIGFFCFECRIGKFKKESM